MNSFQAARYNRVRPLKLEKWLLATVKSNTTTASQTITGGGFEKERRAARVVGLGEGKGGGVGEGGGGSSGVSHMSGCEGQMSVGSC